MLLLATIRFPTGDSSGSPIPRAGVRSTSGRAEAAGTGLSSTSRCRHTVSRRRSGSRSVRGPRLPSTSRWFRRCLPYFGFGRRPRPITSAPSTPTHPPTSARLRVRTGSLTPPIWRTRQFQKGWRWPDRRLGRLPLRILCQICVTRTRVERAYSGPSSRASLGDRAATQAYRAWVFSEDQLEDKDDSPVGSIQGLSARSLRTTDGL